MSWAGMFRPGMRTYLIPLVAGATLAVSGFLPWVIVAGVSLTGFPDVLALWVIGLGVLAAVLATLSMITRRNSRHPLLIVGLAALGITFLSSRVMPQRVAERAHIRAQAFAIVEHTDAGSQPEARPGIGLSLGLGASIAIVLFGLTIVVRRASTAYAIRDPNDDV